MKRVLSVLAAVLLIVLTTDVAHANETVCNATQTTCYTVGINRCLGDACTGCHSGDISCNGFGTESTTPICPGSPSCTLILIFDDGLHVAVTTSIGWSGINAPNGVSNTFTLFDCTAGWITMVHKGTAPPDPALTTNLTSDFKICDASSASLSNGCYNSAATFSTLTGVHLGCKGLRKRDWAVNHLQRVDANGVRGTGYPTEETGRWDQPSNTNFSMCNETFGIPGVPLNPTPLACQNTTVIGPCDGETFGFTYFAGPVNDVPDGKWPSCSGS